MEEETKTQSTSSGDSEKEAVQTETPQSIVADYDHDHEFDKAMKRLNECYETSSKAGDIKTAILAQKEINNLLGLYPVWKPEDEDKPPAGSEDGPSPDERREIESQELIDLVGAIEGYLEPLKLSDNVSDTDSDLIRLAGSEIKRLRRKRKKKAGTTKNTKITKGVKRGKKK